MNVWLFKDESEHVRWSGVARTHQLFSTPEAAEAAALASALESKQGLDPLFGSPVPRAPRKPGVVGMAQQGGIKLSIYCLQVDALT